MTSPTLRHAMLALALLAATLALAACGDADDTAAAGTDPVTITLDWFANADHAGVFVTREAGIDTEHGLTMDLQVPSDPAAALKLVGAGRTDFAISYAPEVLLARSQGVPVRALGALVTHPLNSVIARADRDITRPRDLEGKTVGVTGLPSDDALLDTVVRADGGDPDAVRTTSLGFTLGPALAAGRVDAVIGAYWNIEAPEIEAKGVPVEILRLEDHGVPDYDELVLVAGDRLLADRPDIARRTVAALQEGARAAAADPDAAIAALERVNPDLDPDLLPDQVRTTVDLLAPLDETPLTIDPAEWRELADWMRANGILTEPLTVADALWAEAERPRDE